MTTSTRRAILAGLAAASVAGLPAIAEALHGADPVFAQIAEWRRLEAAHLAAIEENDRLETEESDEALDRACGAVCDFEHDVLFHAQPTTTAGAVALLRAIAEVIAPNWGGECVFAIRAAAGAIEREAGR